MKNPPDDSLPLNGFRDEMHPADKKKQKTVLCPANSQQSINPKGNMINE